MSKNAAKRNAACLELPGKEAKVLPPRVRIIWEKLPAGDNPQAKPADGRKSGILPSSGHTAQSRKSGNLPRSRRKKAKTDIRNPAIPSEGNRENRRIL